MVDDILFEKQYLLDYASVLEPNTSWLVAVKCDLDIVRGLARQKDPAGSQAPQTPTSTQFMTMWLNTTSKSTPPERSCRFALAGDYRGNERNSPRAFL